MIHGFYCLDSGHFYRKKSTGKIGSMRHQNPDFARPSQAQKVIDHASDYCGRFGRSALAFK